MLPRCSAKALPALRECEPTWAGLMPKVSKLSAMALVVMVLVMSAVRMCFVRCLVQEVEI